MCYAEITLDGGDSRYGFTRSWTEPYRAKLMESAMKCFTLISAGPGQDRKQFQQWFLREHAPLVLEHVKGAQRYIVNLADVVPPPVENRVGLAPEIAPAYDVITELWMGSARDFRDPARLYGSVAAADAVHKHLASRARAEYSYRVTEIIEKDVQPIRAGERSPGSRA
jgi:EthD domain